MQNTVLITGSSRGIGRAIALRLADDPYHFIINYNSRKDKADDVVRLIREKGRDAIAIRADVSDYNQVEEMYAQIRERFGGVDVLVNNAGVSSYGLLQDIDPETWTNTFGVNVHSIYYCTKLALETMIPNKSGVILNISSMWGGVGAAMETLYSTTKGAVNTFTKAVAKEVAYSGIRVNAIAPGPFKPIYLNSSQPMHWITSLKTSLCTGWARQKKSQNSPLF